MGSLVRRAVCNRVKSGRVLDSATVVAAVSPRTRAVMMPTPRCDVFINHRGVDTKRTVAGLLYDRLAQLNVRSFLDNRTMEPGDKLFETINAAILQCKIGVAIFSPRYCESCFCLHELSMMVESRKKLIPIFCDVKPSELLLTDIHCKSQTPEQIDRFKMALQEAKYTVGITFDSQNGNFADLVSKTAEIVLKNINQGSSCH